MAFGPCNDLQHIYCSTGVAPNKQEKRSSSNTLGSSKPFVSLAAAYLTSRPSEISYQFAPANVVQLGGELRLLAFISMCTLLSNHT